MARNFVTAGIEPCAAACARQARRLESRALDVDRHLLDLETLLRGTLGKDIDLVFARAGGLWQTLVDPPQLESALLNLLANARDAMPGGGRLTVETANVHLGPDYVSRHTGLPAGQYVMVAVSDTGQGIAAKHLSRVFEPSYTTKASSNGPGSEFCSPRDTPRTPSSIMAGWNPG